MMSEILKKSAFLQSIEDGANVLIWHSLFGFPQVINREGWDLINSFEFPRNSAELLESEFENSEESIRELKKNYFLISPEFDDRRILAQKNGEHLDGIKQGKRINYLSLILSEACNFACTYCISSSMIDASYRKGNKSKLMCLETAIEAVDIFLSIQKMNGRSEAYINFGGGEPLLNWPVLKKVLEYCSERYRQKFDFTFRINTNASLITNEIAHEFKRHDVKVALSLDGIGIGNDLVRIDKSGKSAFEKIIKAIDLLEEIDFGVSGFSTTLTGDNFFLADETLIDFCKSRRFNDIRIDLDVIHLLNIPVEKSVEKIIQLKRQAEAREVHVTGFWERAAENLSSSILEKHIAFCGGAAGRSMCVSPSREVFICGYSSHKYADLSMAEIISSLNYEQIIKNRLVGELDRCKGCMIEGQCIGGCHISEEFNTISANAAMEYNCQLYKRMTTELIKDSLREAVDAS